MSYPLIKKLGLEVRGADLTGYGYVRVDVVRADDLEALLELAPIMYAKPDPMMGLIEFSHAQRSDGTDTHTARLIMVEPIETSAVTLTRKIYEEGLAAIRKYSNEPIEEIKPNGVTVNQYCGNSDCDIQEGHTHTLFGPEGARASNRSSIAINGCTIEQIEELKKFYEAQTGKKAEEIGKPCAHEGELRYGSGSINATKDAMGTIVGLSGSSKLDHYCKLCGIKLRPTAWEEVK
jgi:hypothetical protein